MPLNQSMEVEIAAGPAENGGTPPSPEEIRERLRKLESLSALLPGPVIPLEALRRENLYDERA